MNSINNHNASGMMNYSSLAHLNQASSTKVSQFQQQMSSDGQGVIAKKEHDLPFCPPEKEPDLPVCPPENDRGITDKNDKGITDERNHSLLHPYIPFCPPERDINGGGFVPPNPSPDQGSGINFENFVPPNPSPDGTFTPIGIDGDSGVSFEGFVPPNPRQY